MKKLFALTTLSLLMLGGAQAQTQGPVYGEVGYTLIRSSGDGLETLKPGVLRGILGYDLHPNIALEGMAGFSIHGDKFDAGGFRVKYEISRILGLMVKPKLNITNNIEVFARVGYAKTKEKVSLVGIPATGTFTDDDIAFGAGLNYKVSPSAHVGVDYMSYYKKDGYKIEGVTVGAGYRF